MTQHIRQTIIIGVLLLFFISVGVIFVLYNPQASIVLPSSSPKLTTPTPLSTPPCDPTPTPGQSITFIHPVTAKTPCSPYKIPSFGPCQDEWDAYNEAFDDPNATDEELEAAEKALKACATKNDIPIPDESSTPGYTGT